MVVCQVGVLTTDWESAGGSVARISGAEGTIADSILRTDAEGGAPPRAATRSFSLCSSEAEAGLSGGAGSVAAVLWAGGSAGGCDAL